VNVLKKKYAKENLKIVLLSQCSVYKDRRNFDAILTARELPRLLSAGDIRIDLYATEGQDSSGTFDVELSKKRAFVAGVRSDYTYSQSILDAAYMSKFGVLDVPLNLSAVEDHVYELAFDSDEVFFSALLIEDISKAEKYLTKGVEKYNLVELYPCFYGCLTGGGQMFARDMNEIEARLERHERVQGNTAKGGSRITDACNRTKSKGGDGMDLKDRFILDKDPRGIWECKGSAAHCSCREFRRFSDMWARSISNNVSEKGGFPLSELYGVISFYSFFKLSPPGKYPIKVCSGTACHVKGSDLILQELENQLSIKPGETTKDGLFSLEVVRCLGCCGLSPAIVVGSNTYGNVKSSTVNKILKEYRRTENASE